MGMDGYMHDWLLIFLAILTGLLLAWGSVRCGKYTWIVYFGILSLAAILLGIAGRKHDFALETGLWPIVWHNNIYLINGVIFSGIFYLLVSNWTQKKSRVLLLCLGSVVLFRLTIFPTVGYGMHLEEWKNAKTAIDKDGVCIQTTGYSCGPAAVVTALAAHDVESHERHVAVAAKANQFSGTQPLNLVEAIKKLYGRKNGISPKIQAIKSVEDIPSGVPCIALVKHSALDNHYVCVLDRIQDEFVIADPEKGLVFLKKKDFENIYLGLVIIVQKYSKMDVV